MTRNLKSKITLTIILFGLALLDQDYNMFESTHSIISATIVLIVIFFGDILVRWIIDSNKQ